MSLTEQIAKNLRAVYFGGNWTGVNVKATLKDVTWQQATAKVYSFNTIVTLVYHTNYYIDVVTKVLHGEPINSKDEYSFIHPPVSSQEEWEKLLDKTDTDAESFAKLIEQLPESKLWETFADEKYGSLYHNLTGIIEHMHYHLGQMVLVKKMVG
ncbi:MAG TPA: DinB family protein [Bacteroidia bacterium]|jgi:hypothetical protein|nr:DinB family protein [Bacteroidia bacterium]